MDQKEIMARLQSVADNSNYGFEVLGEILNAFGKNPNLSVQDILYWLDEKAYYLLTWKNKHLEEGQTEKAQKEQAQEDIIQKMINALNGNPFQEQ